MRISDWSSDVCSSDLSPSSLGHHVETQTFVGLQADDEAIDWFAAGGLQDRVRHAAKVDDDLCKALLHALAGAQVEWHAGPAPVIEFGLDRDEGFGAARRREDRKSTRLNSSH